MPSERLAMRRVRDVIRLKEAGVSLQSLADFVDAHIHALQAIGGVPALLEPDNTKAAVIKACLYDPQINRTYADMAAHYGAAVLPARPRRPRDKANDS